MGARVLINGTRYKHANYQIARKVLGCQTIEIWFADEARVGQETHASLALGSMILRIREG